MPIYSFTPFSLNHLSFNFFNFPNFFNSLILDSSFCANVCMRKDVEKGYLINIESLFVVYLQLEPNKRISDEKTLHIFDCAAVISYDN